MKNPRTISEAVRMIRAGDEFEAYCTITYLIDEGRKNATVFCSVVGILVGFGIGFAFGAGQ